MVMYRSEHEKDPGARSLVDSSFPISVKEVSL
jgi:hypothetical protein